MNDQQGEVLRAADPSDVHSIRLLVNGRDCEVLAAPGARLSEVLRERLGLTGTKVGCDAGDCGACTVLLDGRQVCSCLTAVAQVDGREVITVEGLSGEVEGGARRLTALQQAFLQHGAAQCGICTPGMLMAAADLLRTNAAPTEQQVCDALGGVLCRCTGYRKIIEAVLAVARGAMDEASPGIPNGEIGAPAAGAAVGSRLAKVDGVPKVTGAELYGADTYPAGCLWLRVVRSPHARAGFRIGDLGPLRSRHGLAAVLTAADVPENSFGIFPQVKDQPVLARGYVRYRGEAVLALVGEQDAVLAIDESMVPIEWYPEPAVANLDEALRAEQPLH